MARVILTTHWTGGDVYPFLHIGKALKERGHYVILFTHCHYADKAAEMGLDFVAWDTPENWAEVEKDLPSALDPINDYNGSLNFHRKHLTNQKYRREYRKLEPYCRFSQNTVIVARHGSSVAALLAAEKYNIPVISVYMSPSYLTQLQIDEAVFGEMLTANLNALRHEIGLPLLQSWTSWICSPRCSIGLWPEWFAPPDPEWPAGITPVGFPIVNTKQSSELPEEVLTFIAAGEPPVLISGGTSKGVESHFYETAASACRIAGCRALLVTRHPELVPPNLPSQIRWFKFLNFEALMPEVKAIIHHGGIGTLSCALKSGIPQLLMAHNVDRPFNAALLQQLGVGEFFPLVRWNPQFIAAGLNRLFDPAIVRKCQEYSQKIGSSDTMSVIGKIVEDAIGNQELLISKSGTAVIVTRSPAAETIFPGSHEVQSKPGITPDKRALIAYLLSKDRK